MVVTSIMGQLASNATQANLTMRELAQRKRAAAIAQYQQLGQSVGEFGMAVKGQQNWQRQMEWEQEKFRQEMALKQQELALQAQLQQGQLGLEKMKLSQQGSQFGKTLGFQEKTLKVEDENVDAERALREKLGLRNLDLDRKKVYLEERRVEIAELESAVKNDDTRVLTGTTQYQLGSETAKNLNKMNANVPGFQPIDPHTAGLESVNNWVSLQKQQLEATVGATMAEIEYKVNAGSREVNKAMLDLLGKQYQADIDVMLKTYDAHLKRGDMEAAHNYQKDIIRYTNQISGPEKAARLQAEFARSYGTLAGALKDVAGTIPPEAQEGVRRAMETVDPSRPVGGPAPPAPRANVPIPQPPQAPASPFSGGGERAPTDTYQVLNPYTGVPDQQLTTLNQHLDSVRLKGQQIGNQLAVVGTNDAERARLTALYQKYVKQDDDLERQITQRLAALQLEFSRRQGR